MTDFWNTVVKTLDNEKTSFASDETSSAEFSGYLDTGSYILNAGLSGSLFGGAPNNKVTMWAGEESVGKTWFLLSVIATFMAENPTGAVFYYDTESAVTNEMLLARGIDSKRVIKVEPETIQEFKTHALRVLDTYMKEPEKNRPPLLMALDSLGNLSTTKELADSLEGVDTRDMTRAQMVRAAFRTLTLKLGKAGVGLQIANHVYTVTGAYVPTKEVAGGGGSKYAASTILFLSKKKDREEKEVVGNIIKVKIAKSRFSKENKEVEVKLSYEKGLDRYYGLIELGEKYDIIKRVGNRYEFPDGTKVFEKEIYRNPTTYFTSAVMQQLEQAANKEFRYGTQVEEDSESESESD